MKNQGKFQELEGRGEGGWYDKHPLEWKIQGVGVKRVWIFSGSTQKFILFLILIYKCIFFNFHEPNLRLISMCLAHFSKFCWINEGPSTFYCWWFKISRLNMKHINNILASSFCTPTFMFYRPLPPYFLVLLITQLPFKWTP